MGAHSAPYEPLVAMVNMLMHVGLWPRAIKPVLHEKWRSAKVLG